MLGSEIAGELEDGTRVMAITSGAGGYAELAAVDRAQIVPLPDHAIVRGGRVVPADVPDGVHPADPAGARPPRLDGARVRGRRRRRLGGDPGRARARRARGRGGRLGGEARRLPLARRGGGVRLRRAAGRPRRPTSSSIRSAASSSPASFARLRPLGTVIAIGSAAGAWPPSRARAARRAERRPRGLLPRPAPALRAGARRRGGRRAARAVADGRAEAARRRRAPARRGRAGARARRVAAERRQGRARCREGADHGRARRSRPRVRGGARRRGDHRARSAGVRRRRRRRRGARSKASSTRRS